MDSASTGNDIGLEGADSKFTRAELVREASLLASKLRDSGATGSEPIVLQISNEPSHVIGFLGIWDCGAVAVPLHVGAAATERPRTICLTACQSPAPSVVASLRDRDSAARSSRPRGAGARGVKKDHDRHVVTLARGTGDDRGGAHPHAFLNSRADHGGETTRRAPHCTCGTMARSLRFRRNA